MSRREDPAERRVLDACRRLNIRVEKRGVAWHLIGPGIDITTTSLELVKDADLRALPNPY